MTCRICQMMKPESEFYRNSRNQRLYTDCKECNCAKRRAHRAANLGYYRDYDRARANTPERIAGRASYNSSDAGRETSNKRVRAYIARNPQKKRATQAVNHAVRTGRLIRQPCEVCGEVKAQAHHDDYSKPLDVRWLCATHHAEWHRHNTPKCPPQDQEQAA